MNTRKEGAIHYGYGRMWSEPKEKGLARFFQLLREPATTFSAPLMVAAAVVLYALTMTAVYKVAQLEDRWGMVETTNTRDEQKVPVSRMMPGANDTLNKAA